MGHIKGHRDHDLHGGDGKHRLPKPIERQCANPECYCRRDEYTGGTGALHGADVTHWDTHGRDAEQRMRAHLQQHLDTGRKITKTECVDALGHEGPLDGACHWCGTDLSDEAYTLYLGPRSGPRLNDTPCPWCGTGDGALRVVMADKWTATGGVLSGTQTKTAVHFGQKPVMQCVACNVEVVGDVVDGTHVQFSAKAVADAKHKKEGT